MVERLAHILHRDRPLEGPRGISGLAVIEIVPCWVVGGDECILGGGLVLEAHGHAELVRLVGHGAVVCVEIDLERAAEPKDAGD